MSELVGSLAVNMSVSTRSLRMVSRIGYGKLVEFCNKPENAADMVSILETIMMQGCPTKGADDRCFWCDVSGDSHNIGCPWIDVNEIIDELSVNRE